MISRSPKYTSKKTYTGLDNLCLVFTMTLGNSKNPRSKIGKVRNFYLHLLNVWKLLNDTSRRDGIRGETSIPMRNTIKEAAWKLRRRIFFLTWDSYNDRGNETGKAEPRLNCSKRKINYLNEYFEDYLIITNITKNKNKLKILKKLCRRKPPILMS